jgi:ketol-acid reductoisomerase
VQIQTDLTLGSFETERIADLGGETVVRGGRHLFAQLPAALAGVRQIGVIGWGSQGPAQAQNLRDSLAGTGIRVAVGLREGSASFAAARAAGFDTSDGTLGEMFEVIRGSDLVLLLISDAAQAELHEAIFDAIRPGATLGLSHGFLLAHLETIGARFADGFDVIAVCPKGMGPSVRRLYEQGREVDGAGINCSVAVERDVSGRATDRALAWAIGLGAPWCFATSLKSEVRSDVFGERGILLGAVHGIVESLYRRFVTQGSAPAEAFRRSAECVTGPISAAISRDGLLSVSSDFGPVERGEFERAYALSYEPVLGLLTEIYDEVASGNEIRSVVMAGKRLRRFAMPEIEGSPMWQVGDSVRAERSRPTRLDPTTAGIYCATMIAQVDLLLAQGHPRSEVVNESIIEAVDSLNPYMHARGVAYMIDNCSTTARLGARRWGPRFDALLSQQVFPALDAAGSEHAAVSDALVTFQTHEIHRVLAACAKLRPAVDISVQ